MFVNGFMLEITARPYLKFFLKGKIGKNYNIGTGKRVKNLK